MKYELLRRQLTPAESLPTRGARIEIDPPYETRTKAQSLPTRGAWIEILSSVRISLLHQVAPHTGSDLIPSVCDTKLFENLGNSLFAVFLEIPFISSSEYFQLCIRRPCIGALLRIAFFCTLCVVDVFRHTLSFFTDKDSTPVVSDTGKLYF